MVLVVTALTGQAAAPAGPAAQPSPAPSLKQIIEVRSRSPLCTELREKIGPALAGLLQNDVATARGVQELNAMQHDAGEGWFGMDQLHLENDISAIVRNLDVVDRLLADEPSEGRNPDDTKAIAEMKAKLRAVADSQRAVLNIYNGTLQTDQLHEMLTDREPAMTAALSSDMLEPRSLAPLTAMAPPSELPSNAPRPAGPSPDPRMPANVGGYEALAYEAYRDLRATNAVEAEAAHSILPRAAQCPASAATPRPFLP